MSLTAATEGGQTRIVVGVGVFQVRTVEFSDFTVVQTRFDLPGPIKRSGQLSDQQPFFVSSLSTMEFD